MRKSIIRIKRVMAIFLSFIMVISIVPSMSSPASADNFAASDILVLATPFALQGGENVNNIKLEWNSVNDATTYVLSRSETEDGLYTQLSSSSATIYDDYDLLPDRTYYYKVTAIGAEGTIMTSPSSSTRTFSMPSSGLKNYDNTKVSVFEQKSKLFFDGVYYKYVFESDDSGFNRVVEQTSSDGIHFSGERVVLSKIDNAELNACKFESVNIVKRGTQVVMWAHYENNEDYTLARVSSISGTPGGSFTYHGSFQPQGNQSRDLTFFADDDDSGYLISASNDNATLKMYKLTPDWTEVLSAGEFPAITLLADQHREAPAMIKQNGWYYLFTSQTAGWYPSQGGYIAAQTLQSLASATLRPVGNTVTYGAQSGSIAKIGDHYAMMANRWSGGWATPDPALNGAWSSQRMLPITLNSGYATYEYYTNIHYNAEEGILIPVQSGKILSLDKPTLTDSDTAGVAGYTGNKANDGIDNNTSNFYQPATNSGNFTWTVDLGKESIISQIDVTFRITRGSETYSQYILSASKDGNSFTTIKDQSDNKIVGFNENIISDSTPYRYIRILVTGVKRASNNSDLNADWTRGFNELTVYGTPPESTYTNVPVGTAWYDNTGKSIQAHGGGFLQQGGWYYWVGEDKTSNSHNTTGINLYKSKDLLNWELVSTILSSTTNPGLTTASTPGLVSPQTNLFNMERPKLLYDQTSKKFVLFAHWENGSNYGNSHILIASADAVDGHYTILHNYRPGVGHVGDPNEKDESYTGTDNLWGYGSRDFTVYQDPDNGEAYLISTQDWQNIRVYKLINNSTDVDWENSYLLFSGGRREAPAMIKSNGVYYIITSSQSGWYPNQAMYSYTTDISDSEGWSALRPVGNNTTFYSQPTNIMEIEAANGSRQYVYMGDRWNPDVLGSSTYVWLPLTIDDGERTMTMNYTPGWSFDSASGQFIYPDVSNVSQGKPLEGEDNVVSGKLLKYVNDGLFDESDTWSSDTPYYQQNKVPYSVTTVLQNVYDLSRMDISFKQFNGSEAYYAYTVQGSNDNLNWTVLADETQNKTAGFKSTKLQGKYQYVKLNVTAVKNAHNNNSTADWENGLLEVQIYANNLSRILVPLPVVSKEEGQYMEDQKIELSNTANGANIYYTLDGSDPTEQSTLYTGPITLTLGQTTLKAVAYADGMEPSGVVTKKFNIIDPNAIVSVTSPTEFAITSDEGAAGLPTTLEAVNALGQTVTVPVTWNTSGLTFSPYTSVKVTGELHGYSVNATVNVVNPGVVYLISGGSKGVSSFHASVKAKMGEQLVNDVSDQAFDGKWGYSGVIGTDIGYHTANGLYESGWYAYGNKSIDYDIYLESGSYSLISGYKEWWTATRGMTFSAKDEAGTVLASKAFTINKNTTADQEKIEFTLNQAQVVRISVSKMSGSDPVLAWLAVEKRMPVTKAVLAPAAPDGEQNWYRSPVSLTLAATEEGGTVTKTVYSLDQGATFEIYSDPVTFDQDGEYSVYYFSTDALGVNEISKSIAFKMDLTAPVTVAIPSSDPQQQGVYSEPVAIALTSTDILSGTSKTLYSKDGQTWLTYDGPVAFSQSGEYVLSYYSVDSAGNTEGIHSLSVKLNLPDTTANANLKGISLQPGELTPAFDPDITTYRASVSGDVESVTVSASVYDAESTLVINEILTTSEELLSVNLNPGENVIPIVVTAKDGVTDKTYTLTVTRESDTPQSAQDVADSIAVITAPAKDATHLTLPLVPDGFTVAIKSSNRPDVIGIDGTIAPSNSETMVQLILEVTRTSDSSTASTAILVVTVPGKTQSGGDSSVTIGGATTTSSNAAQESAYISLKADFDSATGIARAQVTANDISKAFGAAVETDSGYKFIQIEIPAMESAHAYELQLPAAALMADDSSKIIQVKTATATISLPSNMFSADEFGEAGQLSIQITKVDTGVVQSAEAASLIGSRPVIEVNMKVDNKVVEFNNPDVPIRIVIPYTPTASEAADADHLVVLYLNDNGGFQSVPSGQYEPQQAAVTFTVTHFSKYAVAQVYRTFDDLGSVTWARKQIEVMASKGVILGTSGSTFSPKQEITRADFIQLLVTTFGLSAKFDSNFTDVQSTDYYYNAVGIAKKLSVTEGFGDNRFEPSAKITRQEMMTLTARAMRIADKLKTLDEDAAYLANFKDASKVSAYAAASVASLIKHGVVSGDGKNLSPLSHTTRAEAAVILYNAYHQ